MFLGNSFKNNYIQGSMYIRKKVFKNILLG